MNILFRSDNKIILTKILASHSLTLAAGSSQANNIITYELFSFMIFAKHWESVVIGLAASSTSKGPQIKTTEPMVSIKVTNYRIHNYVEF